MADKKTLRVDLHTHSAYSYDSRTPVKELVSRAREAGIDRLALTDHNVIEGAWAAQQIDPEMIIVGEEISTAEGADVIGLFLSEQVRPGMTVADTIAAIRDQDGVVYIPHPYAYLTGVREKVEATFAGADMIEGYNSRAFFPSWNARAIETARTKGLPLGAGSDAHFGWEVGRAFAMMPAFEDAAGFRAAMQESIPCVRQIGSPMVHIVSFALARLTELKHGGRKRWEQSLGARPSSEMA